MFLIALLFLNLRDFRDYLTSQGWLFLFILLLAFSFLQSFTKKWILPDKKDLLILGLISFVFVLFSFLRGSSFLEEKWLYRYSLFLGVFLSMQLFSSERKIFSSLWPLLPFVFFLCAESLYQYFWVCDFADPGERSCYASRFWNINMLSQALVLSVPFLFSFRTYVGRTSKWLIEGTFFLASQVILLSACRSSILALMLIFAFEFLFPRHLPRQRLLTILFLSITVFVSLSSFKKSALDSISTDKAGSSSYRLNTWVKTVELIRENPMGLGTGMFEYGFLPFKRELSIENGISQVDKSPHNEILRILSEEGVVCFLSILFFIGWMVFRNPKENSLLALFALGFTVEAFFQFPTDLYFPQFLLIIPLGLTFSSRAQEIESHLISRLIPIALALSLISVFYVRQINFISPRHSAVYCRLFPDNWKACGDYFKNHYDNGNLDLARQTILPVVQRQPFNFIALHFTYMVAPPEQGIQIACLYTNLFNGREEIPASNSDICPSYDRADIMKASRILKEELITEHPQH